MYTYTYVYTYIHIYIYREREIYTNYILVSCWAMADHGRARSRYRDTACCYSRACLIV